MKKIFTILSLLLAAVSPAKAANEFPSWFSMGENDTLRIEAGSDTVTVPVKAHFSGFVSQWNLTLDWPEGLEGITVKEGPGMADIPYYCNSEGEIDYCDAQITMSQDVTIVQSMITVHAYWPLNGFYIPYGNAAWGSGDYAEMFYLTFKVEEGFSGGTLSFDGMLLGDMSFAGGVGNLMFYIPVEIVVNHAPGDVNCDGRVSIADVTDLINQLLRGATTSVSDVNGDGQVNIADVTTLISQLLQTV